MEGTGRGILEKVSVPVFSRRKKKDLYYIKSWLRAAAFHATGEFLKTQRNSRPNNPPK